VKGRQRWGEHLWWHNPGKQTNGDKPIGIVVTRVRVKGWLCSTLVGVGGVGKDGVQMLVIPFNSHLSLLFSLPLIQLQMLFHLIDTMNTLLYIPSCTLYMKKDVISMKVQICASLILVVPYVLLSFPNLESSIFELATASYPEYKDIYCTLSSFRDIKICRT